MCAPWSVRNKKAHERITKFINFFLFKRIEGHRVAERRATLSGEGNRTFPMLNKQEIIIYNNTLAYWLTIRWVRFFLRHRENVSLVIQLRFAPFRIRRLLLLNYCLARLLSLYSFLANFFDTFFDKCIFFTTVFLINPNLTRHLFGIL